MSAQPPVRDPLAACLAIAARLHGMPTSEGALTAGLPLEAEGLTLALLPRAAERAGLEARVEPLALDALPPALGPAILLLKEGRACVLAEAGAEGLALVRPEAPGETGRVAAAALAADYEGRAVVLRPLAQPGAREGETGLLAKHHWFWGTLRREWRTYAEVLLATVLLNLFALASPLFFMNVYDRVVPNQAVETLWVLALGMAIVTGFDLLVKLLRGWFIDVAGKRADLALSSALFARVMDLRLDQPRQSPSTLASNLREFESLRDFFTSATLAAVVDLPFALVFIAAMAWVGGLAMVLPVLVAIPLVAGAGLLLQPVMRNGIRRSFTATEAKYATVIETLAAMEHVKHLNAASQLQRRWEGLVDYVARESLLTRLLSSFGVNFAGAVQAIAGIAVLIAGVYAAASGNVTMGAIIACVTLSGRALQPLGQVAGLLTRYHSAMSALAALERIMGAKVERPPGGAFVGRARLEGRVEFRGVSFRYPGQEVDALRELSFAVQPGDRVAIIGRMGSGKSTLARLLVGLYAPGAGHVLVDGIDTRHLDPSDLRRNVGYLPQNVVLFSGSVRHNLTLGAPGVDDETMLRAARLAGVDDYVARHPKGYDLPVGERGEALSGGQRQAVSLARALLLDPPVLLLDEPTAAMDIGAEEAFKQRLAGVLAGRTLIVVTHRDSMLSIVDKLVVMDAGRVVAAGPKADVLAALQQGRVRKAT